MSHWQKAPSVPAYLFVGDSYSVTASYDAFPASQGWSGYLFFSGSSAPSALTGSALGDSFVFAVSESFTQALTPNTTYSWRVVAKHAANGTKTAETGLTEAQNGAPAGVLIAHYETMIRYCQ